MKVVFLDRDGVINEFPGNGKYVTKLQNFRFIEGSLEALKLLKEKGYTVFVISNQAGVGKGVYSESKLKHITKNMLSQIRKAGGRVKKVYYCTHKSDLGCDCRKPRLGYVHQALDDLNKTMRSAQKAYFVGDTETDILTGFNAGCKTIFVTSGREDRRNMRKWIVKPDYVCDDLFQATKIITDNHISSK